MLKAKQLSDVEAVTENSNLSVDSCTHRYVISHSSLLSYNKQQLPFYGPLSGTNRVSLLS